MEGEEGEEEVEEGGKEQDEIDDEEVGSVLRIDEYGGDEDFSWVLLDPADEAPQI